MKIHTIALAAVLVLSGTAVYAQGNATGKGATTGDPAASSQNANPDKSGMSPTKSGSGTSTSDVNNLLRQFKEMQRMMRSSGIVGGMARSANRKQKVKGGRVTPPLRGARSAR